MTGGHHLVLGELKDFITGETLEDTHDERYRQNIARLLVEQKGYFKDDIEPRCALSALAGDKRAIIKVDFKITLAGKVGMIVKYGPGSIVTRRRPALAASRLLTAYQIPVVVVTNGEDAEILDGSSGKKIATGLESVPTRTELMKDIKDQNFASISAHRAEMESRIIYAYEVDDSCPCDDTICRLEDTQNE
ncbi:type I restriction enzyme HsdR N-terminal domain-containing protein [Thermodesulfobacteriota bacterium]